ncbi:MAG: hypothetical protein WAO55_13815 [Candidatus Manganitrophaceae bacterium]
MSRGFRAVSKINKKALRAATINVFVGLMIYFGSLFSLSIGWLRPPLAELIALGGLGAACWFLYRYEKIRRGEG